MRIRLAILVTLAACVAGSLGGCKDHDVERLTAVKRDVCACKDARCADQAMSEVPKTAIRSTPRIQAIARDIMECRARLEAADRPSTDPDAEGRGEPAPAGAGSAPAPAAPKPAAPKPAAPNPAPPKAAR